MADRAEIERMLRETYAGRIAGDAAAALNAFAEHACFEIVGAKHACSMTGRASGTAAVAAAVQGTIETFEFLQHEPIDVLIDGDRAAVRVRGKVRHLPTGAGLFNALYKNLMARRAAKPPMAVL